MRAVVFTEDLWEWIADNPLPEWVVGEVSTAAGGRYSRQAGGYVFPSRRRAVQFAQALCVWAWAKHGGRMPAPPPVYKWWGG